MRDAFSFPVRTPTTMQRSKVPLFFLGLSAVIALSALVVLLVRPGVKSKSTQSRDADTPAAEVAREAKSMDSTLPPETPPGMEKRPLEPATADPAALVAQVSQALESGDLNQLNALLGKEALSPENASLLQQLLAKPLRLRPNNGIREVGELELNTKTRWMLTLDGADGVTQQIVLDLRKADGKWMIEKLSLPPAPGSPTPATAATDSLDVADAFLQAVLTQKFEFARSMVDPKTVSDAKIAGLCILFEEGGYQLRKSKPLRALFNRQDTTGYLANIETPDGKQNAQFALSLQKPSTQATWTVTEINLDQLLADYASRVAGGDIYYTPLVKNPAGGDTLALYFDFNEDEMNPRTRRQLEIVTLILKSDPGKKITLSGHADALGTKDYNNQLSSRRADVVRDFLIKAGVDSRQIVTVAKGDSQPRRPNLTESGTDNPDGRRANRRTEIYLDF